MIKYLAAVCEADEGIVFAVVVPGFIKPKKSELAPTAGDVLAMTVFCALKENKRAVNAPPPTSWFPPDAVGDQEVPELFTLPAAQVKIPLVASVVFVLGALFHNWSTTA